MIIYAHFYKKVKKLEDISFYKGVCKTIIKVNNEFYTIDFSLVNLSINKIHLKNDCFYNFESLKKTIEDSKDYFTIVEENYLELLKEFFDTYEGGFIKFHF